MPQDPDPLALSTDFPAPTREEWRALVAAVLAKSGGRAGAGGDPEEALASITYDGIAIRPLYTAADAPALETAGRPGHPPYTRAATAHGPTAAGWDVRTRPVGGDAAALNRAALHDLETGATSLWLAGVAVDDLPAVLEGVYLDLAPIVLDAGAHSYRAGRALLTVAEQRGVDPAELRGTVGADPIGRRARTGADADLELLARLAVERAEFGGLRLATVDATVYHEAGASDGQELGIATAVGVAYLRALTGAGLAIDDALAALEFRWAVTAEQFPSIAKLRAARRVWGRVAELCGASSELPGLRGQYQHAVTSAAMLTRRDPWVNLLRTTIGCFAAAVGGADAITVTPFDAALGVPDEFARRIARNTQSILHDESSLARVVDAAGGSWFVESLTDQLAEKAWDVFTAIERAGGALAALGAGTIEELIAPVRARRADDVAHRRAPITGVTEFALIDEAPVVRAPWPEAAEPTAGLLPRIRYAEAFEALRDRSDAASSRPRVYLATLGPLAAHTGRTGFAVNLFQSAGIECVTGPVEEFSAAGTTVACLCSSDKLYAEEAAVAAKSLRAAGATEIWLAGKVETEGVDGYLHLGCDALAVLTRVLGTLGVAA
jgi:methylmalonyl-CoA mutase